MSELRDFATNNDLFAGILSSINVNSNSAAIGQTQSEFSLPALTIAGGSGLSSSSSSSSSSFVNDEGAGASSSAVSISPSGTVSSSETVFTPGATSSSANAIAIASSTEPSSAIVTANAFDDGNVFAIVPATFEQPILIVNVTPDIPSGLTDIQLIEQSFLIVNVIPDTKSELATVEFSDRINVLFEVDSNALFSSLDLSTSQSSISVPLKDLNVSINLIQQESSQSTFTIYEVVGLSDLIVFNPLPLEFNLELESLLGIVTIAD